MVTSTEIGMQGIFSFWKRHEGNILHNENIRIAKGYTVLMDAGTF